MMLKIPQEVLRETTLCEKNFACLDSESKERCNIESGTPGCLFITPKSKIHCEYSVPFGNGVICRCPTRNALFDTYHI